MMQFLEIRVAQHQPVIGVPQHEGFRNGLDGVAQPQIGGCRALHQAFLLGDIDGDTDDVEAGLTLLAGQFAAHPQPNPSAVGMAHAEVMIDGLHFGVGELHRQAVEIDVVRMDEVVDLAERQKLVLLRQAEDVVHRMRPEDPAARQIPIPQSAAAAIERGVDAAAHGVVNEVGLARARRLPVKGKTENQHHEAGRCRQRHGQRGGGAPIGKRILAALKDREQADRVLQRPHGGESGFAVAERDLHGAGGCAERGERLRRAEHVENLPAQELRLARQRGDDRAVAVGDQNAPAGAGGPAGRACCSASERARQTRAIARRAIERGGEVIGQRRDGLRGIENDLTAMLEHLHRGADADRHHEGDDENGNRAPQQRLGGQEAPISGIGDRLRQPLDRIGT